MLRSMVLQVAEVVQCSSEEGTHCIQLHALELQQREDLDTVDSIIGGVGRVELSYK